MDQPDTGRLNRLSNVTYRGLQIGKVTAVGPTAAGAKATLTIDTSPKFPADVHAAVRSMSAVGEQYVDLVPRSASAPYLRDGSVITARDTSIPRPVGPMLDKLSALVKSIPKDKLGLLLDETFTAFNGAGYDLESTLDSSSRLSHDASAVVDHTRALVGDGRPFLDAQAQTSDQTRRWARNLAGFTDQMMKDDAQFRRLLHTGPGFAQEVSRPLDQVKPTLPVFLANLTTIGQIGVTYHPALEQLLVLLPPPVAAYGSYGVTNNPTGLAVGGFTLTIADPPACTVGFLPPSQWRSPADVSEADTPDNLYCKLPQDSPISVRGARNYPCMTKPGKRAPTVEICNSDKEYMPLAERQHALGPYPLDPNLLSQGLPPDDRVGIERGRLARRRGRRCRRGRRRLGHRRGRRRRGRSTGRRRRPTRVPCRRRQVRLAPTVLVRRRRLRYCITIPVLGGMLRLMGKCIGSRIWFGRGRRSRGRTWSSARAQIVVVVSTEPRAGRRSPNPAFTPAAAQRAGRALTSIK